MSRSLAPSALRMPISRRLSMTETSMIFITPMPPTSREMPAMAPNSKVKVLEDSVTAAVSSSVEVRLKSSSAPMAIL